MLRIAFDTLPDSKVRDRLGDLLETNEDTSIEEVARLFGCSGYVVESVPLALYGAQQIRRLDFAVMLQELIRVGGDTDTNSSIAGQVAGTLIGRARLPQTLETHLPELKFIESTVMQFVRAMEGSGNLKNKQSEIS